MGAVGSKLRVRAVLPDRSGVALRLVGEDAWLREQGRMSVFLVQGATGEAVRITDPDRLLLGDGGAGPGVVVYDFRLVTGSTLEGTRPLLREEGTEYLEGDG